MRFRQKTRFDPSGLLVPLHVFVQPNRQRPSGLECCVVLRPVGGLVAGLWLPGFTHASRLPAQRGWFVQQSRNKAPAIPKVVLVQPALAINVPPRKPQIHRDGAVGEKFASVPFLIAGTNSKETI